MFNIYYINYAKAYEIAMLIDNKVLTGISKEKDQVIEGEGNLGVDTSGLTNLPLLGNIMPKLDVDGTLTGSKSKKVIDTVQVVTTKSTILNSIYKKAKEIKTVNQKTVGQLIKIKNVKLQVENSKEIQGSKALMSGILSQIPVDGMGEMDLTGLAGVLLKDAAYVLSGKLSDKIGSSNQLLLKIPMQADNEMESQYSISDLEIGPTTVLGIYRGEFEKSKIINQIDLFHQKTEKVEEDIESEPDDSNTDSPEHTHFVDVIAIIQELIIK